MKDFKEFIIISEDGDPQRTYLIENFSGCFEIILQGDEYHERISTLIDGFLEGLDYMAIPYMIRYLETDWLGDRDDSTVKKRYLEDDTYEFYIELEDKTLIELTEVR